MARKNHRVRQHNAARNNIAKIMYMGVWWTGRSKEGDTISYYHWNCPTISAHSILYPLIYFHKPERTSSSFQPQIFLYSIFEIFESFLKNLNNVKLAQDAFLGPSFLNKIGILTAYLIIGMALILAHRI